MNKNIKILLFYFFYCIITGIDKGKFYKQKFMIKEKRIIYDVLFVNGCQPKILPHPYRYRILHQIEQLKAGNLNSKEIYYLNLEPLIVRDFRVIIFYRCPWTERINDAINLAKSLNKKVLFDIDDLVIDTKYTDLVPYVQSLSKSEKQLYDSEVVLMGKTLKQCEGAITTTEALANELKTYISEVFINRNVASEEMFKLSQKALDQKSKFKNSNEKIIGYFSGSITHNSDIEIVIPAFLKILREFKNVKLLYLGLIDVPVGLKNFSSRIIRKKFVNWEDLPLLIASVDINIAPLIDNIFNSAKSENKWVEAALVKVPTIASNIGAFKEAIIDGQTGLLCNNTTEDWYKALKSLIVDEKVKKNIADNAFEVCKKEYNTLMTGHRLSNYINLIANKHIGFVLPSNGISGGILVVLIHASYLKDEGWDVDIFVPETEKNQNFVEFKGHKFNIIGFNNAINLAQYDVLVATLYSTLNNILNYSKVKKKLYLVQGYETDFSPYGDYLREQAEKTYSIPFGVEYITISKWCETWLRERYGKKARYAPNGIDLNNFKEHKRNLKKPKIRILIEGDSSSHYKNVDESFKIVEKLDKEKFEVWYMSYNAEPKKWYRVDRFLRKIPFEKVAEIYEQCDILLKSSWLESFSFPPLEMMATDGYCILVANYGNLEYLKNEENCIFYKLGDIDDAVHCVERLISNEDLQNKLYENGLSTAKKRDWKHFKKQILRLYNY